MKRYNSIIIFMLLCSLVLLVTVNLRFQSIKNDETDKSYQIEINRAFQTFEKQGFNKELSLDNYKFIKKIQFLPTTSTNQELTQFFGPENDSSIIRVLNSNGSFYFVKFTYETNNFLLQHNVLQFINILLFLITLFLLTFLLYIKYALLKPFHELSKVPLELSKGHLNKDLKEDKSRFFGRFVWGLDMLRETLKDQKSRELELVKEKKSMILSLSHDIKTPLSAIKLYAKALSTGLYNNNEKLIEISTKMDQKVDEIEGFVQNIIKTSKEDFLELRVENKEFYLVDLIKHISEYYKDKLSYLKIDFPIDPYDNYLLYGDLDRYIEVLENIIENAIKYGDGKTIHLSFQREEDYQLIIVKNTGNTLPPNETVHIFESFWRGSNSTGQRGSGLGLFICRQLVTKMEGEIFASSLEESMHITVVAKIL